MSNHIQELKEKIVELEAEKSVLLEELKTKRNTGKIAGVRENVSFSSEDVAPSSVMTKESAAGQNMDQSMEEFVNTGLLLKSIAANSPDAIFAKDHEGKYLFFNLAAAKMVGKTVDEVLGRKDTEVFAPEAAEVVLNTDRMVRESGKKITIEEHIPIQGEIRIFHTSMFPYLNDDGDLIGTMGIARDVTEFKELESQLLRAQRMESLGTLAGGVAHNLNNVLAPIIMSIDLLKAGCDDQEKGEILEAIGGSARRGAELVHKVQCITDARGGDIEEVDIIPIVDAVARMMSETITKEISVEFEPFGELWPVTADATQLHQVFFNLGLNARDAMPHGGILKFAASNIVINDEFAATQIDASPGDYILVEVSDSGVGMEAEVADRIFEPFFTTKDLNEGAGLGLTTSLSIVKNYGGFIKVYTEVNTGTVVQVYLPSQRSSISE